MQISKNDVYEIVENAIEKYIDIQNNGKSFMMQLAEIDEQVEGEISEIENKQIIKVKFSSTQNGVKNFHMEYHQYQPLDQTWEEFMQEVRKSLTDHYGTVKIEKTERHQ